MRSRRARRTPPMGSRPRSVVAMVAMAIPLARSAAPPLADLGKNRRGRGRRPSHHPIAAQSHHSRAASARRPTAPPHPCASRYPRATGSSAALMRRRRRSRSLAQSFARPSTRLRSSADGAAPPQPPARHSLDSERADDRARGRLRGCGERRLLGARPAHVGRLGAIARLPARESAAGAGAGLCAD